MPTIGRRQAQVRRVGVVVHVRQSSTRCSPLHELETKVMAQIWDRETATVRDVLTAVNASADRQLAYTTILTIMDRPHLGLRT